MPATVTLCTASRKTTARYTVHNADPVDLFGRPAVPFAVELSWYNGDLSDWVLVYAHKLKADGTVGRAQVTKHFSPDSAKLKWLSDLVATASEPLD